MNFLKTSLHLPNENFINNMFIWRTLESSMSAPYPQVRQSLQPKTALYAIERQSLHF